ncbi:MAG: hypothetical protein H7210_10150 [Pyrinomonadaceae bacterium]|nr:hypothetical protein [Phycisphaerales bacterium]
MAPSGSVRVGQVGIMTMCLWALGGSGFLELAGFGARDSAYGQAEPAAKPRPAEMGSSRGRDGQKVIRADIRTQKQQRVMTSLSLEPFNCRAPREGLTDYLVDPAVLPALTEAGIEYTVLIEDIQTLIDAERTHIEATNAAGVHGPAEEGGRGLSWFSDYKDYAQIQTYVTGLEAMRPDLATTITAGASLQGRDIYGLRITSSVGTNKPGILIHGLEHAREWVTGMTATYVADRLVRTYDTDPVIHSLLDTYEFYIFPVMNPDGYVHSWTPNNRLWRKNRRSNPGGTFGVDINRNWGYQWGGTWSNGDPASDTYRGPSAFSEPETVAMASFVQSHPNMLMYVDIHNYLQLVLSPWGYTNVLPPDASLFAALDAGIVGAINGTHGRVYVGGPTYTTVYPTNGASNDWVYGVQNVLAWGTECRDTGNFGFLLPANQIIPNAEEVWAGFAWAALWLRDHALYFNFPQGQPVTAQPATSHPFQLDMGRARQFPETGTLRQFARVGYHGPFVESSPVLLAGLRYQSQFPAGACGQTIQYYFQARTTIGDTVYFPPAGPTSPFLARVADVLSVFSDNAETQQGWSYLAADDTATQGRWLRGNPVGTAAQPEDDHTPGAGINCFFTGQGTPGGAVDRADVDGGSTTLTSPSLDLTGRANPKISYWRWYSNHIEPGAAADTFRVSISANNGATWTPVETVGPDGPQTLGGWLHHEFDVKDFVTPTASVRVRFVAEDVGNMSNIEAAVDDFLVTDEPTCPPLCPGDWNGMAGVNSQDFFDFMADFFMLTADFNGSGLTDSQDFFDFVAAFFSGC